MRIGKFIDEMSFLVYIIFLCISSIKYSIGIKNGLGCRDNENRFVDWYVSNFVCVQLSNSFELLRDIILLIILGMCYIKFQSYRIAVIL